MIMMCLLCREDKDDERDLDTIEINPSTYVEICDECLDKIKDHCGCVHWKSFDLEREKLNGRIAELQRTIFMQRASIEAILGGKCAPDTGEP